MRIIKRRSHLIVALYVGITFYALFFFMGFPGGAGYMGHTTAFAEVMRKSPVKKSPAPVPLLKARHPVDWWFVFKFNAASFPDCGAKTQRKCLFGGDVQSYRAKYSQQYVYASSKDPSFKKGTGCAGDTLADPIGATFNQVYTGSYYYVLWNDQFYNDPPIKGCNKACSSPWGHSKGLLAWNKAGEGFVMQVSTPSWPASGNSKFPRQNDGNTLGCVKDDDVEVSQHFFSLKLNKDDLVTVLKALQNASVVTDPGNSQIVHNGGPADVQDLVSSLGKKSKSTTFTKVMLSSGVELISKPSKLNVPPWQLVSAALSGLPIRAATWWAKPKIYSTDVSSPIGCWDDGLAKPGPVQIATSGKWQGTAFGLTGGQGTNHNHAKIGVSLNMDKHYAIFGDMNQQGALSKGYAYENQKCSSSQNGRGGTFYVIKNKGLFKSVTKLIRGDAAPATPPKKKGK